MLKKRKIAVISLFLALFICLSIHTPSVEAEENIYDGIIQVNYGYYFDDGSFDIWASAPAIVINKNTVITYDLSDQDFSETIRNRQAGYATIGIDINALGTSENTFTIFDGGSSLKKATEVIKCESDGNNFLIIKTEEEIDRKTEFTPGTSLNDKEKFAVGFSQNIMDTYHYASSQDLLKQNIRIIDETDSIINFSIDSKEFFKGSAILNGKNQIYGLIIDTDNGGTAIIYSELERILDENNIIFEIGSAVTPVDKTGLENEISLAKTALATTTDTYTEESQINLEKKLSDAEKELTKQNISQERIDSLTKEISDAREALEVKPKTNFLLIIIIIVFILIVIAALVLLWLTHPEMVYKILGVKRKEDITVATKPAATFIGQDEEIPGMGAESSYTTPGKRPAKQFDPTASYQGGYIYEQRTDLPSSPVVNTNILQNDENSNDDLIDIPYLIRVHTQERIIITGNNFTIGREYSVNYRIPENISISKEHCRFVKTGDTWYIMDNKSSNKTYVDGNMIEPNQYIPLHDTSEIILANEKFIFRYMHEKPKAVMPPVQTGVVDTNVLTNGTVQTPAVNQQPAQQPFQQEFQIKEDPDGTDVLRSTESRVTPKAFIVIEGKRIFLNPLPFTLGRSEHDSYILKGDRAISRHHLTFSRDNGIYYAMDDSSNGTTLNDVIMERKQEYQIKEGDKFDILGTEIEFHTR